jgi:hypothetical protein
MSKEFQIRDGNLIASFDLENEDGDIDFCKLLKVSHGVADEIGMFVDYVATNKIIKDQSKQIADLETKLGDMEQEQIKEMQEHQEAMELADKTITNLVEDNRASQEWYKKQLAEKDAEVQSWKDGTMVVKLCELEKQLAEKEELIIFADRTIKGLVLAKEIDKISFCIEQLEKVKELLYPELRFDYSLYLRVMHEIDNQIKQLKEMSDE